MVSPIDHVVLISIDTLRTDAVAASPNKAWTAKYPSLSAPVTSTLDALAARGVFFTNCVSAAPYTSASHATFITGKWPLNHGCYTLFDRPVRVPTLFSYAKQLGFRTLMKVDFPVMLGTVLGFTRDVDTYLVEDDDGALEALDPNVPSFSLVHFGGAHVPYGFHNLRFGGNHYVEKVEELSALLRRRGVNEPPRVSGGVSDADLGARYKRAVAALYQRGEYDLLFQLYLDGVTHFCSSRFDPFMERLLDRLGSRRTLIIIFGDHGEEYDETSCGHQDSISDGVLRVPVIIVGPGIQPALVRERIRSIDIAPTIIDLLQANKVVAPAEFDGESLVSALTGKGPLANRTAIALNFAPDPGEFLTAMAGHPARRHETVGRLPHLLFKEVIYKGEARVAATYLSYETTSTGAWTLQHQPPTVSSWSFLAGKPLASREERPLLAELQQHRLTARYSSEIEETTAAAVVGEDIRDQLRKLGYRV